MKAVWIIAKKELATFFDSLIAYILIIVFLGLTGFFTWIYGGGDVFFTGQASIMPFFAISLWTLFFFIPAITMKMLAEEKRGGTLELLLTKPVSDWQIVLGKFLASLLLVIITLGFSLPYYFAVAYLGPVDHGAVWCGYLGLILMSMTYIGIGILASSVTNNQIVAFLLSLMIGVLFLLIFGRISSAFGGILGDVFYYLDIGRHFDGLSRGVIDSRDVIYFISIAVVCLFGAESALAKRNVVE